MIVLPGDTPLLRARDHRRPGRAPPRTDAACTMLSAEVADPTGYGRVVRGKDDRVTRIVEERDADRGGAGDPRDQHLDLLLPPQRPGPRPAPHQPGERPGRVLPDRRGRGAPPRRLPGGVDGHGRRRGGQRASTTGPSWPPPRPCCGAAPPTSGCGPASPWSTPSASPSTPRCASAPTSPSSPGPCCRARPWSATTPRSVPTPAWSTASSARDCRLEQVVGRDAEIGDGAVVGPYAVLEPGCPDPPGSPDRAVLHCELPTD